MRQSELNRANREFEERMEGIREASMRGDIHASPVIFGLLEVQGEVSA